MYKMQQHIVKILYTVILFITLKGRNIKQIVQNCHWHCHLHQSHLWQNYNDSEFVIFVLFAMQLDWCNIQRVHDQK